MLSILLFILVRRSLRFGLTEVSQMAQAIGDGNLDARVDLDKENEFTERLTGIKGQYLIFENRVINLRKYAGYHMEFVFET